MSGSNSAPAPRCKAGEPCLFNWIEHLRARWEELAPQKQQDPEQQQEDGAQAGTTEDSAGAAAELLQQVWAGAGCGARASACAAMQTRFHAAELPSHREACLGNLALMPSCAQHSLPPAQSCVQRSPPAVQLSLAAATNTRTLFPNQVSLGEAGLAGPLDDARLAAQLAADEVADTIVHGEPFTERRSTFQAHLAPVHNLQQVRVV